MQSLLDDRTARARVRDETLRLFGERGPDAVTVRDIAAAAGVSPALVVRHYGSKEVCVRRSTSTWRGCSRRCWPRSSSRPMPSPSTSKRCRS
ncbi:MAG TPA: helix-turn-helix domain-containing protein [Pseudonocardiaceae bacterium]